MFDFGKNILRYRREAAQKLFNKYTRRFIFWLPITGPMCPWKFNGSFTPWRFQALSSSQLSIDATGTLLLSALQNSTSQLNIQSHLNSSVNSKIKAPKRDTIFCT